PQVDEFMQQLARICRSLLCHDGDTVMVDYLGQGFHNIDGGSKLTLVAIEKAYQFVRSEATRFQDEGCEKLANRYAKVLGYFHSRLSIWGLDQLREGGQ